MITACGEQNSETWGCLNTILSRHERQLRCVFWTFSPSYKGLRRPPRRRTPAEAAGPPAISLRICEKPRRPTTLRLFQKGSKRRKREETSLTHSGLPKHHQWQRSERSVMPGAARRGGKPRVRRSTIKTGTPPPEKGGTVFFSSARPQYSRKKHERHGFWHNQSFL